MKKILHLLLGLGFSVILMSTGYAAPVIKTDIDIVKVLAEQHFVVVAEVATPVVFNDLVLNITKEPVTGYSSGTFKNLAFTGLTASRYAGSNISFLKRMCSDSAYITGSATFITPNPYF